MVSNVASSMCMLTSLLVHTDLFADMVDSLVDDTDLIRFEELIKDYVRNSTARFAGDSTLSQKMVQDFVHGKELNPDEECVFGAVVQAAPERASLKRRRLSRLFVCLTAWSPVRGAEHGFLRNSTDPGGRDEMVGHAEMIKSLLEDTDFLLVKKNRNNVQNDAIFRGTDHGLLLRFQGREVRQRQWRAQCAC